MKRLLSLLIIIVLFATACGGAADKTEKSYLDPKKPIMITLWHYYAGETQTNLEQAVSEFNRTVGLNEGVIVDAVRMGGLMDLEDSITASVYGEQNAAPLPTIFSTYADKALELDAMGALSDLGEWFSDEEQNKYVSGFLADGIFEDDRLLVLPLAKSTELLYLNATAWAEFAKTVRYGVDKIETWEGLLATAREYRRWSTSLPIESPWYDSALFGIDSVANFIVIGSRQLGTEIVSGETSSAIIDEESLRRIYDIYVEGMAYGYFDMQGKYRSDDLRSRDLISYLGSSSGAAFFPTWVEHENKELPIELLPLPYPVFEAGERYTIQQGAGLGLIKSTPAEEAGAVLFLKWFTDAERNLEFALSGSYLPVQESAYENEEFIDLSLISEEGGKARENVVAVYKVVFKQVNEMGTYAARPFPNSYELRLVLQDSLIAEGKKCKKIVSALREEGLDDAAIAERLDLDNRFDEWLADLLQRLDGAGIVYRNK